jgi:predicted RNase H-like nuclease (RuvC/YqgF family)
MRYHISNTKAGNSMMAPPIEEKDESLWSDDDTEGPPESAGSIVNKLTWQVKELERHNRTLSAELEDSKRRITELEVIKKELEEIEQTRVKEDFRTANTIAEVRHMLGEVMLPSSLFPKLVHAGLSKKDVKVKVEGDKAKEVVG